MNNRQKPIEYLKKYIGIKEGSKEHQEILDTFNNSGLCKRYKMTTNDAWCATTVSAAFIATGLADIFPCVECSCANMVKKATEAGIWVENDAYVPDTGDIIMYDWQDNGIGDNTGRPDHVGIVVFVNNGTIKVIEGNKNDSVDYREIKIDSKTIRGYITPKYEKTLVDLVKDSVVKKEEKTEPKTESKIEQPKPAAKTISKEIKFNGIVNTAMLNVRKAAGGDAPKCETFGPLKKGSLVKVCDTVKDSKGTDWYYINYNGKYGFVNSTFIKRV